MLNNNAVFNDYDAKGYCLFCYVLMLKDVLLMLRNAFLLLEYAVYEYAICRHNRMYLL